MADQNASGCVGDKDSMAAAAMEAFQPLVLHFSSSTPRQVSLDAVLEVFTHDSALKDRFFVIDARSLQATAGGVSSAPTGGSHARAGRVADKDGAIRVGGNGTDAGAGAAANTAAEKTLAGLVREEYERIALSREAARREALAANARRLEEVKAQYMEDGLSEQDALRAAEEDLKDDEDSSSDSQDDGDDGPSASDSGGSLYGAAAQAPMSGDGASGARETVPTRTTTTTRPPIASFPGSMALVGTKQQHPLYVCLWGDFPSSLADVKELYANGVPLHTVVNITCKAPLQGSEEKLWSEPGEKPRSKVDSRGRPPSSSTVGKRSTNAQSGTKPPVTEDTTKCLPVRIAEHQKGKGCGGSATCCAVGEVYVHTVEFPTELYGGGPEYRLTVPEKVALQLVKGAVAVLSKRLRLYRALTSDRCVVQVPAYAPLPDPRACSPPPPLSGSAAAACGEEKSGGSNPNSRSNSVKRQSTSAPRKTSPGPGGSLGVGVGSSSATGSREKDGGSPMPGAAGEVPPLAMTTSHPRSMEEVAARTVEYEARRGAGKPSSKAFVAACIQQAGASLALRFPSPSLVERNEEARAAAAASPHVLLSQEETSKLAMSRDREAVVRYAMGVLSSQLGHNGASTHVPPGDGQPPAVPEEEDEEEEGRQMAATCAPRTEDPHEATTAAVDRVPLRRAVGEAAHSLFPHPSCSVLSSCMDEALRWAVATSSPAGSGEDEARVGPGEQRQEQPNWLTALQRHKNMQGWLCATRKLGTTELTVLSRGDGNPRSEQSVYAFDAATTFPLFMRYLDYCAAEQHFFVPPPPSSEPDDDDDGDGGGEDDEESSSVSTEDSESDTDAGKSETDSAAERTRPARRRAKRVPTPRSPPPRVDHFREIQRRLRRRCVFEEVKRRYATAAAWRASEVVVQGAGVHGAGSEVQWAFPDDGCTVEVDRTSANTRQLACTITAPAAHSVLAEYEMGYQFEEPVPTAEPTPAGVGVAPQVPARVRGFLRAGRTMQLITEVIADNSLAAEKAVYERAAEEARAAARAEHEAMQLSSKGKGGRTAAGGGGGGTAGRDKNASVAQCTLAEMEEAAVAAIPPVVERAKQPPRMAVSMLFGCRGGDCAGTPVTGRLRQDDGAWDFAYETTSATAANTPPSVGGLPVDMMVSVWRKPKGSAAEAVAHGHEEMVRLQVISSARYLVETGHVELVPVVPALLREYRVILGPKGTCATVHRATGATLVTAPNGERSLYELSTEDSDDHHCGSAGGGPQPTSLTRVRKLHCLASAVCRDAGVPRFSIRRADGVELLYDDSDCCSGVLRSVVFGRGIVVTADTVSGPQRSAPEERCFTWRLGLAAGDCVQWNEKRRWLTFLPAHHATAPDCSAVVYKHREEEMVVVLGDSYRQEEAVDGEERSGPPQVTARLNLRRYRLEWSLSWKHLSGHGTSWYAVDCAFGGCYGEIRAHHGAAHAAALGSSDAEGGGRADLVRVSPWGRLSLEHRTSGGGEETTTQVFPLEYTASVGDSALLAQPLLQAAEVLSPEFVAVLDDSGVALDAEHALHLCAQPAPTLTSIPIPAGGGGGVEGVLLRRCSPAARTDGVYSVTAAHALTTREQEPRDLAPTAGFVEGAHRASPAQALLMCQCVVGSASSTTAKTRVVFCSPCLRRPLLTSACDAAARSHRRRCDSPTLPGAKAEAHEARVICCRDNVMCGYKVSDSIRVFTAATAAVGDGEVAEWWDTYLASLGEGISDNTGGSAPSTPLDDEHCGHVGREELTATAVSTTSSSSSSPREGNRPPTQHPRARGGRLHYWSSSLAPEHHYLVSPGIAAQRPSDQPAAVTEEAEATRRMNAEAAAPQGAPADATGQVVSTDGTPAEHESATAATRSTRTQKGPPLMYLKSSTAPTASVSTGGQAADLDAPARQLPSLSLTGPTHSASAATAAVVVGTSAASAAAHRVEFGDIVAGRRYATTFTITNTSTVPCRYRVTVPKTLQGCVSVAYPHRFLAAGMSDTVTVTLSGWQPPADGEAGALSLTYEGSGMEVGLAWHTVPHPIAAAASSSTAGKAGKPQQASLTPGVVCLGEALPRYQPGSMRRTRHGSGDTDRDSSEMEAEAGRGRTRAEHSGQIDTSEDSDGTDGDEPPRVPA